MLARPHRYFDADLVRLRERTLAGHGYEAYRDFERKQRNYLRAIGRRWHRWSGQQLDVDDLAQEALQAVWQAVDSYEEERGVPLQKWVAFCLSNRLKKQCLRAKKLPFVQAHHVGRYGRRDDHSIDEFHADAEQVARFRRRLAYLVGSVNPRTGALVVGIAKGRGLEAVRQEVYADYSIGGAIRKSRVAMRHALQVIAQLDD